MNKSKTIIFGIVGVLILALGTKTLLSHKATATPAPAARPASLSVTAVTPSYLSWPQIVQAQGAIAAWQESTISTEIGGLRIAQVMADVGTQVKRGQEIATLAQESVLASLHKQDASVAQAKANLAKAKSDADRARAVSGSGALSEQKIQEYIIAEETAQADLASAQAALESAHIDVNRTHILAPDEGVISSRTAAVGTVVNAGSELFKMVRQNRLEWRAEVAAPQLGGLSPGQKAIITLPQGGEVTGHIRMISPTLNSDTRMALVYVDLPQGSFAKAGMYAEGRIELGQHDALTIPLAALVLRDGTNYVFEIGQDHIIQQRQVKTGRREGDRVEILSGLTPEAHIAASGGAFLNQGDLVNLVK